jgi:hypothetical protein
MGSDPELENRRGLEWLVTARNKCQTLMFLLLERWETLPAFRRQSRVGAVPRPEHQRRASVSFLEIHVRDQLVRTR